MTPIQGALWNALTDDWQTCNEIRKKCSRDFQSNSLQFMRQRYGVESVKRGVMMYRLPQPEINNA